MPIENRNLEPGTRLVTIYKKETYRAEVIAGEEGKVLYRLEDGREFKSLSAAGTALTGNACNGWRFWSVDTAAAPETESANQAEATTGEADGSIVEGQDAPEDSEPAPTYVSAGQEFAEPAASPSFRRVPNQKGVDEGQVRLYCESCQKSFTTPADQPVETCPEGHSPGQSETRGE